MNDDPILARIRKLLAKAENAGATPAEAEALTAKAAQLMARHGIDQALLTAEDPNRDGIQKAEVLVHAPYLNAKCDLLHSIALAYRVRSIGTVRPARGAKYIALVGYASDIERTELMFTSLLVQASYALAVAKPPSGVNTKSYRNGWYSGFTHSVYDRLWRIEEYARQQAQGETAGGKSVELVLADRSVLVDRRFAEEFPRVIFERRKISKFGVHDGQVAGQKVDLGQTKVEDHDVAQIGAS